MVTKYKRARSKTEYNNYLLTDAKLIFATENMGKPTNRAMLLELSHRDAAGDKWPWTKQLLHALEENFLANLAEGIIIVLALLIYGFIERNYKSENFKRLENSNQQLQIEIQKLHEDADKQRVENQKRTDEGLEKNYKSIKQK